MDYRRIVPCLDTTDGKLVKGIHFVDLKEIGDPAEAGAALSMLFRGSRLARAHVRGLGSLSTLARLVLDLLAVLQGLESFPTDVREVNEQIVPSVVRCNEPITLLVTEPLHGTDRQLALLTTAEPRCPGPSLD